MPVQVNSNNFKTTHPMNYPPILMLISIVCLLINPSFNQSLQSRWSLLPQSYPPSSNISNPINFQFSSQIQPNTNQIIYQMDIFACKLIRYQYVVRDSDIYLEFLSYVADRYLCANQQLSFLRTQIDMVFYFHIVAQQLQMYKPNGNVAFNLQRAASTLPADLQGQWLAMQVQSQALVIPITVNATDLTLCDGNGVIGYNILNPNQPNIVFRIKNTQGCIQNQLYTALYRTRYFRYENSILAHFYDQNFVQILSIRKISNSIIPVSSSNNSSQNSSSQNVSSQNLSVIDNNTLIQNISFSLNTNATLITNQTQNISISQLDNKTENGNASQNTNMSLGTTNSSNIITKTLNVTNLNTRRDINNQNQKNGSTNPNPQNGSTNPNPQNGSTNLQTTSSNASNKSLSQRITSINDLTPLSNQSLLGKWLITLSANPNFDFTALDYFLLILPTRIILYGGCNVFYTNYQFSQNVISNITVNKTQNLCPDILAQVQTLTDSIGKWKYVQIVTQNNATMLHIYDQSFNLLNMLTQII